MNAILDLFAGPGGWSQGLRALGHRDFGMELDAAACQTRNAAGHPTVCTDVATYPTAPLTGKVTGLIGSAPCQPFSAGGRRKGLDDADLCHQVLHDLAHGRDTRDAIRPGLKDPRSLLVVEPLRYALDLRPEWIALEQVPAVLPLFDHTAHLLEAAGYATWTGLLNAADYGVPQTRRRAFLLASRTQAVAPPAPTHTRDPEPDTLFGPGRAGWISMATALGLASGEVTTRGEHTTGGNKFTADLPAWALTGRARSWTLRVGKRSAATRRRLDDPAPTLLFAHATADVSWLDSDGTKMRQLTVAEAAVLQTFPTDYPWCGSRTKQFEQIGNAVPPRLAAAVLATVVPARLPAGVAA